MPEKNKVLDPDNLEEAKAIIEHLQLTIKNKDKRFIELAKSEEALRNENSLLYERIEQLKELLYKVGVKVA
jgi:hypothetical protein